MAGQAMLIGSAWRARPRRRQPRHQQRPRRGTNTPPNSPAPGLPPSGCRRAIFLVNVPVGILALIAAALVVPRARGQRRPRLDPLGAAGVSVSLALALVP